MASPFRLRQHWRKKGEVGGGTYLGDMPLHAVRDHPALPQRRPVALGDRVLVLVVHGRVRRAVVHARLARDDHVALEAAEHGAAHDGRPRVDGLHDLARGEFLLDGGRAGVRRPLAVRRRRRAGKVRLELAVQVLALAEAADEDDARHDAALGAQAVDLPLDEVADLLDDRVENVLDLLGGHDHEARVESGLIVVGEAGEAESMVSHGLGGSVREAPTGWGPPGRRPR